MTRPSLLSLCLCLCLAAGLAGLAAAQRRAQLLPLRAVVADGLILADDGQPEDIGYGFQRARAAAARNARDARSSAPGSKPASAAQQLAQLGLDEDGAGDQIASAFRERLAARQRRQRHQQQQQQQLQHSDWRHDHPSVSSFYPPTGPTDAVDNPEHYLEALREAWARYQQQTGAIDVGPDDLTDLETLQFLEALGEDIPGARKRSAPSAGPARQYASGAASPWDWAAPLAWSGYQLRKRAAGSEGPDFQDDSGEWADDGEDGQQGGEEALVPGSRLAALYGQQLFDERYDDPAVKRLLLAKRSAQSAQPQHQHWGAQSQSGGDVPAMRRRKKSTRPALADAHQQGEGQGLGQGSAGTQRDVHKDLARIFGETDADGEPAEAGEVEPPLALPLLAAAEPDHDLVKRTASGSGPTSAPAPAATTAPGKQASAATSAAPPATVSAGSKDASPSTPAAPVAMNPIGHAHETDQLAREHHQHAAAPSLAPDVQHAHAELVEHAPPMVSAEGPHGHDHAVHAEDKGQAPVEVKAGSPSGAAAGPGGKAGLQGDVDDEPLAPRRLAKKSIDWSQYFGLDRRRKKSLSLNDVDAPSARIDPDWMMRHNLVSFRVMTPPGAQRHANINKRVAIKREGASPDALLLGSWGRAGAAGQQRWDGDEEDDGEDDGGGDAPGRCPAVTRLAESCRGSVGSDDALLPLCVLYQACHLCGAAMGVQVGSSCEAELARRGAELCAFTAASGRARDECHGRVAAVAEAWRARGGQPDDAAACAAQPCLARFFLTAPAVAFTR